jgi:hypothetical protein
LLLDDLHKRGNIKGGWGKWCTIISSHLKSYQKIDEPKGHEDEFGCCLVQSLPCHSHPFTVIKQSFRHSWNSGRSSSIWMLSLTYLDTQPANAIIRIYICTLNLPGLKVSKVTPIKIQNFYSFSTNKNSGNCLLPDPYTSQFITIFLSRQC